MLVTACGGESSRSFPREAGASAGASSGSGASGGTGGGGGNLGTGASGGTGGTIPPVEEKCPRDAEGRVVLALNTICDFGCPLSVEAALDYLSRWACTGAVGEVSVTTGCGVVAVSASNRINAMSYYYDEASGRLSGVFSGGDTPSGPCNTNLYYYGEVPSGCPSASTCIHCTAGSSSEDGFDLCPPPDGP
jgi:hypothetical protein